MSAAADSENHSHSTSPTLAPLARLPVGATIRIEMTCVTGSCIEGIGQVGGDAEHLLDRERSFDEPRGQRLAFQQFHHEIGRPGVFADVVNRADVWMREDAMARASRSNRARALGSPATSPGSTFSATARSRRVSRALYTSPMPPDPRGARISYGPRRAPRMRAKLCGLYARRRILPRNADLTTNLPRWNDSSLGDYSEGIRWLVRFVPAAVNLL